MGPQNSRLGGGGACGRCQWAFGGTPSGATKRCPRLGVRMRAVALGPSVDLPVGPRNSMLGGGGACGR
eukprot:3471473-Pyramimonas_sp.AAC.2